MKTKRNRMGNTARIMIVAGVLAVGVVLGMSAGARAAPVVTVDMVANNTLIFRDYNGTSDWNISYNVAPTQNVSGSVSTWTYGSAGGDPQIRYADGAGFWDHATYPWVRTRHQRSRTTGGNVVVWEQPAQGGEGVGLPASTTFVEGTGDPNSTVNAPLVPNGHGYRVDPVDAAAAGDVFTMDYVLMDRHETLGLGEWDKVGDIGSWNPVNIGNVSVSNSIIAGTAVNNGDAQLNLTTGFDGDKFGFVEIRMKYTGAVAQLFWRQDGEGYSGSRVAGLSGGSGEWHTYLLDFTDEATWANTMFVRLDPTGQVGSTFEVDYIRARTNADMIPEPATMALLGLAVCGLGGYVRKRKRS